MSTDALKLTYADIKTVKTRGAYQLVLEGPIEEMKQAMDLLGPPSHGSDVWCAVARLRLASEATKEAADAPRSTLAQQAGILCNDTAFRRYLADREGSDEFLMFDLDMAADDVRRICGVASRADLDRDPAAAEKFRNLRADFKLWLSDVGAAA